MTRLIAGFGILCLLIAAAAEVGDSIGGAGFWYNVKQIVFSLWQWAIIAAIAFTVFYLGAALVTDHWLFT